MMCTTVATEEDQCSPNSWIYYAVSSHAINWG